MIVALSVVAFVMVVVGLGCVVQGTPFTRLEWGWTMVISGTVAATGGILLGGVAILVSALRRVEGALAREGGPGRLPVPQAVPPRPDPPLRRDPSLADAPSLVPEPPAGPAAVRDPRPMPTSPVRSEPATPAAPDRPPGAAPVSEAAEEAESRAILAAGDLVSDVEDAPLTPSAVALPAEEPLMAPEAGEASHDGAETPKVVGTYASGGNRYVMYADGTIRADTPRGEFTFASLDELKAFVAAGGEEPAGAA